MNSNKETPIAEPDIINEPYDKRYGTNPDTSNTLKVEYPLLVIKNLTTNILHQRLNTILEKSRKLNTSLAPINIYLVNQETNKLMYWTKAPISKEFSKALDDYVLDYSVYTEPKVTGDISQFIVNSYEYIVPSIIDDTEDIDYEDYISTKVVELSTSTKKVAEELIEYINRISSTLPKNEPISFNEFNPKITVEEKVLYGIENNLENISNTTEINNLSLLDNTEVTDNDNDSSGLGVTLDGLDMGFDGTVNNLSLK